MPAGKTLDRLRFFGFSQTRHMRIPFSRLLLVGVALLQSACAGFSGGWESLPYVGDHPPPVPPEYRTPYEARMRNTLAFDGIRVEVDLRNQVRTSDMDVVLYVVPISIDPREVSLGGRGRTRLELVIEAQRAGFKFVPGEVVLGTSRGPHRPVSAVNRKLLAAQGSSGGVRGVESQPIERELVLAELNRPYVVILEFATEPPDPRSRDITLDLSNALQAPVPGKSLPLIRFLPVRWQQGYT